FQVLRSSLDAALHGAGLDRSGTTVMLAGVEPGDGDAITASNLGAAMALAGKCTIIVDLNRTPSLHRAFGVPERPGLIDVAQGRVAVDDALVRLPGGADEPRLLPLGGPAGDLDGLLSTDALATVIGQLRSRADVVLIDGPPLLTGGDVSQISAGGDGVVVVV